jgi:hypothetical protein
MIQACGGNAIFCISGVGETLAVVVLAELPGPDVVRSSAEVVAHVGLNPRRHQSATSIDRLTRISNIGNAVLRAALYMPAMSAMRYDPAIIARVTRLKSRGRLKPKQIVVAAMRKLLTLCFGVLKTGKPFDSAIAMAVESHQGVDRMEDPRLEMEAGVKPRSPTGRAAARGLDARLSLQHAFMPAGDASLKTAQVTQNAG